MSLVYQVIGFVSDKVGWENDNNKKNNNTWRLDQQQPHIESKDQLKCTMTNNHGHILSIIKIKLSIKIELFYLLCRVNGIEILSN